jgi:hypothetical protein
MKRINCFVLLGVCFLFVQGCDFRSSITRQEEIDQKILTKIKQDTASLANLEASYTVNYINFQENNFPFFGKHGFYIRNDIRTYFYGYSLKDADIKLITENNQRILRVKLPEPRRIAVDQFTVEPIKTSDPNYIPRDEKGQLVDIEKEINARLDKATEMYEQKTIDKTREMSQLYFQDVADRFGLKLQLEFAVTSGSKDERTKK